MDIGMALRLAPVPLLLLPFVRRILKRRRSRDTDQQALNEQPDSVRLRRRSFDWQNQATVQNLTGPLLARSFSEVGDFSIAQAPELKVRLLVNPARSIYACIYERPGRETWLDLVSCYEDSSIASFSTAHDPRTECRPGDMLVFAPELSADMLYTRMLKERPQRPLIRVDAKEVVRLYEDAYKEQAEWRMKRGPSAVEVAKAIAGRA